ncbi:MAG TPA: threonine/serine dehydratase [Acetobacteraceae bacterium]|nr:threonine/serine dehydratase [Acetobacteraceae bacterium]
MSNTPAPLRLAQLPWICITPQSEPVRAAKEAGCLTPAGSASVAAMVDRSDIVAAAARISGYVRHTPLLRLGGADLGLGFPVVLKLELLQHAGSFKPRGAFNRLLSSALPAAGVIAASGGNHGAAVAYVARALDAKAEIFVPGSTPETKVTRIASYDACVVRTGATYAEALAASRERQAQTGALEVHAYDDPEILAGQGTVGREFEQDAPDLTHVLVATGGGGLIGGIAAWYAGSARVISVEPGGCPALHDALGAGKPVEAAVGGLAADSLGARQVGKLMFPLAQAFVADAVLVPDAAIAAAQRLIWERLRLITEPGGATALAALLCGAFRPPAGARVGVLLCGGNTDPGKVAQP